MLAFAFMERFILNSFFHVISPASFMSIFSRLTSSFFSVNAGAGFFFSYPEFTVVPIKESIQVT